MCRRHYSTLSEVQQPRTLDARPPTRSAFGYSPTAIRPPTTTPARRSSHETTGGQTFITKLSRWSENTRWSGGVCGGHNSLGGGKHSKRMIDHEPCASVS